MHQVMQMHPGAVLTSEHALMWTPEAWSLCSRSCGGGAPFLSSNSARQIPASKILAANFDLCKDLAALLG